MSIVAAAIPLLPGKGEEWRRWAQELQGSRHAEYAASRYRLGIHFEQSWIGMVQGVELVFVYLEAEDSAQISMRLINSSHPFDCWYRKKLQVLHGLDITQSASFTHHIGFIGMGHMGSHMALRLLSQGYTLTVYDRTPEKTLPAIQRGARVGETPRVVAATSDVILSSVADDAALEAVMQGPEGILAGSRPGTIYIEMSTVSPSTIRRVALLAKEQGVHVIDAPVSGSVPQVDAGSLVIFVGGEQETYQASKPILDVLGTMHYMGASGMGATMKLVANALLGLSLQAIAEALVLGEKAGLERAQLIEILKETAIVSPRQKTALENAERREYPANFPLPLMFKDFGLILRLASELAVSMPATAAAQKAYAIAQARGVEDDVAAIIAVMEELAAPTPNASEGRLEKKTG